MQQEGRFKKKDTDLDAVAIIYKIDSDLHPFHFLNNVPGSVATEKIVDFDKNMVVYL